MLQELQVPQILGTLSASRAIADSVLARLAIGASVNRSWRPFLFTWFFGWWWIKEVGHPC